MMSGRLAILEGLRDAIGCFVLLGTSTIAAGLRGAAEETSFVQPEPVIVQSDPEPPPLPPLDLRFPWRSLAQAAPDRQSIGFLPAMLEAVSLDEGPIAIHRTFLALKKAGKAGFANPRQALGALGGGAVRFCADRRQARPSGIGGRFTASGNVGSLSRAIHARTKPAAHRRSADLAPAWRDWHRDAYGC